VARGRWLAARLPAPSAAEVLERLFYVAEPRLAVAGLNPHAGEDGAMGEEDAAIVRPAVERLLAGRLPEPALLALEPGLELIVDRNERVRDLTINAGCY